MTPSFPPETGSQIRELERRLGILERRVRPGPRPTAGATAPGQFVTVAAVDTPSEQAAAATFRCSGANDNATVALAVASLGASGGTVYLLAGTFVFAGAVTVADNVAIVGAGPDTIVNGATGAWVFVSATGVGRWEVRDLTINVHAAGTGGISTAHPCELSGVAIIGTSYVGYGFASSVGNVSVHDCRFSSLARGVSWTNVTESLIRGSVFTSCGTGIYLDSSSRNIVADNVVNGSRGHGIHGVSGANDNLFAGNAILESGQAAHNTYSGIILAGFRNTVQHNLFRSAGANKAAWCVTLSAFYTDTFIGLNDFLGGYQTTAVNDQSSGGTILFGNRPGGTSTVLSPDAAPGAPHAKDQEFDATSSSLPAGWSWLNQGGAAYSEAKGWGNVLLPIAAGVNVRGIKQAVPAVAAYTATAKMTGLIKDADSGYWGLALYDSASGKVISLTMDSAQTLQVLRWATVTSFTDVLGTAQDTLSVAPLWFRIKKNSAASFDFAISPNGSGWRDRLTAYDVGAWMTPTDLLIFGRNDDTAQTALVCCDYFRVTEP